MIPHSKPTISKSDIEALANQAKSGMHAPGEKTREFENKIKILTRAKYVKAVQTGTAAIHLALLALNIKKGDEVIIPSYVCQSVLSAVKYTQATPILVDISPDSSNISAQTIKSKITKKTKAIVVPHMFGIQTEINKIKKLKIPTIEDCAHFLSPIKSKGKISTFSFYATKMISTGHGGAIATDNRKIAQRIEDLLKYDKRKSYKIAYNSSLTDLQSSLGISQIKKLPQFIKKRKQIAQKYSSSLKNLPIIVPNFQRSSVPFRYIIKLKNKRQKDQIKKHLRKNKIIAEDPIFKPLHQYLKLPRKYFPNTEKAFATSLSIPIYPSLKDKEINYIIKTIKNYKF